MKDLMRAITPPFLWRAASRMKAAWQRANAEEPGYAYGVEQAADFYDYSFEQAPHWRSHYIDSPYYFLWTLIQDRVRRMQPSAVLDIGCGPGQVACLVRDAGVPRYMGLDFSEARIAQARSVCPEYEFVAESVFESDLLEHWGYDCVILMEFLEHVEDDLSVLARIRPGARVLATVPNFPARGHVRQFADESEVKRRYEKLVDDLEVVAVPANTKGKTYFVLEGRRRALPDGA